MHRSRIESKAPPSLGASAPSGPAGTFSLSAFTVRQSRIQPVAQIEETQYGQDDGHRGEKGYPIESAEKGHLAAFDDVSPRDFRRLGPELQVAQGGFHQDRFRHDQGELDEEDGPVLVPEKMAVQDLEIAEGRFLGREDETHVGQDADARGYQFRYARNQG